MIAASETYVQLYRRHGDGALFAYVVEEFGGGGDWLGRWWVYLPTACCWVSQIGGVRRPPGDLQQIGNSLIEVDS